MDAIKLPARFDQLNLPKGSAFLYQHRGAGKVYHGLFSETSPNGKFVKVSQGSGWDLPTELFVVDVFSIPGEEKKPEATSFVAPKSTVHIPLPPPPSPAAKAPASRRALRAARFPKPD